jgi:NAD(P)-dependent dehydrogenase (short-subunit alcohol dehydrogenase family)
MRVIITGASGILGSAIYNAFTKTSATVLGLAHSRPSGALQALDLTDSSALEKKFAEFLESGDQSARKCGLSLSCMRAAETYQGNRGDTLCSGEKT